MESRLHKRAHIPLTKRQTSTLPITTAPSIALIVLHLARPFVPNLSQGPKLAVALQGEAVVQSRAGGGHGR